MQEKQQMPSVGRAVHYQSFGTPNGEYNSLARAATVTEVGTPGSPTSPVGLCIMNPTGLFFTKDVQYSETPKAGCWNWPPRT